jgi:hypothetical protein
MPGRKIVEATHAIMGKEKVQQRLERLNQGLSHQQRFIEVF